MNHEIGRSRTTHAPAASAHEIQTPECTVFIVLTLDMSGRRKAAQLAFDCPLDGRVRLHLGTALTWERSGTPTAGKEFDVMAHCACVDLLARPSRKMRKTRM
jgi:hypothetical protein